MSLPRPDDFHILINLILTTALWDWTQYYPSFIDEETKGQGKTKPNEDFNPNLSDLDSFLLY